MLQAPGKNPHAFAVYAVPIAQVAAHTAQTTARGILHKYIAAYLFQLWHHRIRILTQGLCHIHICVIHPHHADGVHRCTALLHQQVDRLARHPQANRHFRAQGHILKALTQQLGTHLAVFVATVKAHGITHGTLADADGYLVLLALYFHR